MTKESTDAAWFRGVDPGGLDAARDAIENGRADTPADWPTLAIEAGFADDEDDYYSLLHNASINATQDVVWERERADDEQLKHSIRAMDDDATDANEGATTGANADGNGTEYDDLGFQRD